MADSNQQQQPTPSNGNVTQGSSQENREFLPYRKFQMGILLFAIFNGLIGFSTGMVKAVLSLQVISFEKHFHFEPTTVASTLFVMEYANAFLVIMFLGFAAKTMNIPRVTGLFGIGMGIMMAAPGFLNFAKPYTFPTLPPIPTHSDDFTCNIAIVNSTLPHFPMPPPNYDGKNLYKMMLVGISGAYGIMTAVRWGPLSFVFFDNNIPNKKSLGLYLAITIGLTELSRPFGYWFNLYVNKLPVDLGDTKIPPQHPMFVTAWWLGPIVFGFLTSLLSIPMLLIPANIFTREEENRQLDAANVKAIGNNATRGDPFIFAANEENIMDTGILAMIKSNIVYYKATSRVFTNTRFVVLFILWGVVIIPIVGLSLVSLQYTIYEFNVSLDEAKKADALTNSVATILAAIVSAVVCQHVYRKKHLLTFIIGCVFISFVMLPISFFLGCDNVPIGGLKAKFGGSFPENPNCKCENSPVLVGCGSDGRNYKNPCYAGCNMAMPQGFYANCSNVEVPAPNNIFIPMLCADDCHDKFVYYNIMYTISTFIHKMADIPKILLALRIIAPIDRGLAFSFLGLSSILSSVIGPLLLVKFFNENCLLWFTDKICMYFDRKDMRMLKTGVEFNTYIFAFIMWIVLLKVNSAHDKKTRDKKPQTTELVETTSANTQF